MATKPTKRTPEKRAKFLELLSDGLTVTGACLGTGICKDTAYEWRRDDPPFAADWDKAIQSGTDHLEDVARKRAKSRSDVLLIFLLKSRNPDRFRDRVGIDFASASPEDIERAISAMPNDKLAALIAKLTSGEQAPTDS